MKSIIQNRQVGQQLIGLEYFRFVEAMMKSNAPNGFDQREWRGAVPMIPPLISLKIARITKAHTQISQEIEAERVKLLQLHSATNAAGLRIPTLQRRGTAVAPEDRVAQAQCDHPWAAMLNASPSGGDEHWTCSACGAEFTGVPNTVSLLGGGVEFKKAETELYDGESEIDVPFLTMKEIEKLPPLPPGALEPLLQFIDLGEPKSPDATA